MSVNKVTYLIYGVHLTDHKEFDKAYNKLIESFGYMDEDEADEKAHDEYFLGNNQGIGFIDDPMSGSSFSVGKYITSIDEDEEFDDIDIEVFSEHEKHLVEKEVEKLFGITEGFGYKLINHYS